VGGHEDVDLRELADILLHEDDGEVCMFVAVRQSHEVSKDVVLHYRWSFNTYKYKYRDVE
jgi:hypothetical protein